MSDTPRTNAGAQTCNCRWDGEVQVQQCTLHEAHVDAIHEWAERAKAVERELAAAKADAAAEQESRGMFVARLEKMQEQGDQWLTVVAVLALLNDCDRLASLSADIAKEKST
jgi:hypothetical protein